MLSQVPFLKCLSPLGSHLTSHSFFFCPLGQWLSAWTLLSCAVVLKFLWEEAEGTVGAPEGLPAVRAWSLAVGVLRLPAVGLYALSRSVVKAGGRVQWQPVWSLVAGQ